MSGAVGKRPRKTPKHMAQPLGVVNVGGSLARVVKPVVRAKAASFRSGATAAPSRCASRKVVDVGGSRGALSLGGLHSVSPPRRHRTTKARGTRQSVVARAGTELEEAQVQSALDSFDEARVAQKSGRLFSNLNDSTMKRNPGSLLGSVRRCRLTSA